MNRIRKPNFVVIGAPKCGTTSLYFYLKQHPDVFLPNQKELHYFSYEQLKLNSNGPGDSDMLKGLCATREDYLSHYEGVSDQAAIGEISPSYLYYGVSSSIKKELGCVKIVVMVRKPTDKAYSQYMHLVRDYKEKLSFADALSEEQGRKEKGWSAMWRYVDSTLYKQNIEKFINEFGSENVHVIVFEEFIKEPRATLSKLFEYLGIRDDITINTDNIYNRSGNTRSRLVANILNKPNPLKTLIKKIIPYSIRISIRMRIMDINTKDKSPIEYATKKYLDKIFQDDISSLETLLGRKLPWNKV